MKRSDSIHFTGEDYAKLKNTYNRWWSGNLGRPITPIIISGNQSSKTIKGAPLNFSTAWDMSIPVTDFIEHHDAHLDRLRFYGGAFPYMHTSSFGPGTAAAFLGCTPIGAS